MKTFDLVKYAELLAANLPKVIATEEECDQALKRFEVFHHTKDLTPEQSAIHDLLLILIKKFEDENYRFPTPSPFEILRHVLLTSGTYAPELVALGVGDLATVHNIIDGREPITEVQAKILGDRFKVKPDLFLRSDSQSRPATR